jgi:hypothetical protein
LLTVTSFKRAINPSMKLNLVYSQSEVVTGLFLVGSARLNISTLSANEIRQKAWETELLVRLWCREYEQDGRAFTPASTQVPQP